MTTWELNGWGRRNIENRPVGPGCIAAAPSPTLIGPPGAPSLLRILAQSWESTNHSRLRTEHPDPVREDRQASY
jgi:hypothetical protein